jgi:hypothetical protein
MCTQKISLSKYISCHYYTQNSPLWSCGGQNTYVLFSLKWEDKCILTHDKNHIVFPSVKSEREELGTTAMSEQNLHILLFVLILLWNMESYELHGDKIKSLLMPVKSHHRNNLSMISKTELLPVTSGKLYNSVATERETFGTTRTAT